MKTELEIVHPVINPGHKIQVHAIPIRNYLIHQVCEPISQMILGLIESDTNNSFAQNSARETRNFWKGWNLVKLEWAQALEFRDAPHPEHEGGYTILLATINEVMTVQNVKVKRLAQQLRHLARTLVGLDSAKMQTWIGPDEIKAVDVLLKQAETVITRYLGTGEESENGYDTGAEAPRYAYGQLIPDIDQDAGSLYEPSSAPPDAPFADVPDQNSVAPRPGSRRE